MNRCALAKFWISVIGALRAHLMTLFGLPRAFGSASYRFGAGPLCRRHPAPLRNCRQAPVLNPAPTSMPENGLDGISSGIREVASTIWISKSVNKFRSLAMISPN